MQYLLMIYSQENGWNEMSDSDLRALYRFIKGLGPAGQEAPAYLPPGQEPKGPYVQFPAPPQK